MNEKEYILVTNREKMKIASEALRTVLSGEEYGVPSDAIFAIRTGLFALTRNLDTKIKISAPPELLG